MKRVLGWVAVFLTATTCVSLGQNTMRELAFYEMPNVQGKSDGNGRLPEAVWETVPVADKFFVYWKVEPIPGEIHSRLRMAYDSQGIYLQVVNQEPAMEKLRAMIEKRGNPSLWTDDCLQIAFDPNPNGAGHVVFTVNSLGTQDDRKQIDASVSLPEWRGEGWKVWTDKGESAWKVEAFFPFSDFAVQAKAGDLWSFNLVRFAYTSGAFQGITWSVGGNYANRNYFGYLFFGGEDGISADRVAKLLEKQVTPPWIVAVGNRVVLKDASQPAEILSASEIDRKVSAQAEVVFSKLKPYCRTNAVLQEKVHTLEGRAKRLKFDSIPLALESVSLMAGIVGEAGQLYWREKLDALIEDTSGPSPSSIP